MGQRIDHVARMFEGVRWSRESTLAETLQRFAGLRVRRCSTLADVDEAADLPRRA